MKFSHDAIREDVKAVAAMNLPALLDSTLLKPDARKKEILKLYSDALANGIRAVCVAPVWLSELQPLRVQNPNGPRLCTVVGFPGGAHSIQTKCFEAKLAIQEGADEIDYVQNVSWAKDGRWLDLAQECHAMLAACEGKLVKVILETSLLTNEELYMAAKNVVLSGIHVVKTSTGFGSRGASEEDLKIIVSAMRGVQMNSGVTFGLKASGGIKTREDALRFIKAGATRIGTSKALEIISGEPS